MTDLQMRRVQLDTRAVSMNASLMTIQPEALVTDADFQDFGEGSGLNGPYLAKLLSSSLTHENASVNLWRALNSMTANPTMKPKFKQFHEETEQAVDVWATLIAALGGNPHFASPIGRVTEIIDAKLIEALGVAAGSTEASILDAKGLEVAMLGAHVCVFNGELLNAAHEAAAAGQAKDAMQVALAQLQPTAQQHLEWCRDTLSALIAAQAKNQLTEKMLDLGEKAVAKVKDALH